MFGVLFRLLSKKLEKKSKLENFSSAVELAAFSFSSSSFGSSSKAAVTALTICSQIHDLSLFFHVFLWSSHKDWNAFPLMWVWIPAGFKKRAALSVFPAACCFTRSSFFSLTGFCKAWYVVFGSAFHAPSASAKGPSWIQRSTKVHDCQTQSIRILQENWIWRCLELNLPNTMFLSSLLSCANLNLGAIERHWLPTGRSSCQNPCSKGVLNAG